MSSTIGALRVVLGVDTAQFTKGLAKAGAQLRTVGKNLSLGVTAPLAGFGGLTVKVAGDFEASMNRVGAATGAGEADLASLREAARDLGATTQFSASQAADAIEVLAKNGLGAADILGGALSASLTLAAASGADLSDAGDIATDVMLQFKKGAGELGGVVNGIAGTLLTSKFGIDDYRLALAQAGGVAGGLGVEFDDFNAAISATSSAFASGSDAGTSFKTFLQRLVPTTKPAVEKMTELGLSFFYAQGKMNSMSEIAETLRNGLGGLSEEARSEALTTLFGTDAMRTAIGLMDAGAAGIDKISKSISEVSAEDQADARMEGFNGALKEMASAFESLQLAIAESGLLEFVTGLVKGAADLLRQAGDLDPKILKLGTVFAGLAAAIGPAVVALGLALTAVSVIGAPIAAIVVGVAALTAALATFWPEIISAKDAVMEFASRALDVLIGMPETISGIFAALPGQMMQIGRDILSGLWSGLTERFEGIKSGLSEFAGGMVTSIKETLGIHSPSRVFQEVGQNIMDGLGVGLDEGGDQVSDKMTATMSSLKSNTSSLFNDILLQGKSFKSSVGSILGSIGSQLGSSAISGLVDFGFSTFLPGFANGTDYAPGGMALVGERGPEIINLPRGSRVTPNHELNGLGESSAPQSLNVSITMDTDLFNATVDGRAASVTKAGLQSYDRQAAPTRQQQIANDPRRRG